MSDLIAALLWMAGNASTVLLALEQHVAMSAASLALGAAIALPLGILVSGSRFAASAAINLVNAVRTIPSLAILAAALPFLGIGFAPSVVALTVLAVPPILINTVVGINEVPAEIVDAGTGMGMTRAERFTRLVLPLASPAIFGGIRLASIQVISGAALASFIGGGGLGDFITAGIAIMDVPRLIAGALPIAALAFLVDGAFALLQSRLQLWAGG